jgi:ubiquinone/menaquinone biosynthesis methyltransferase
VRAEDKAGRVAEVFSKVAARYDVMNDVMSGGLHRLWKDNLVAKLGPIRGSTIVDLAGGTGDVSFRILDALREQRYVPGVESRLVVCDINAEMLQEGRRRAGEQGHSAPGVAVEWVQGDAEALPFPDRSVDALTIAFGLRNVTRTLPALKEVRRVLRRGGRFLCMEFSQERPARPSLTRFSHATHLRRTTNAPKAPPPPPPCRTNWTRLVPPPVLSGHVSSLPPYPPPPRVPPATQHRISAHPARDERTARAAGRWRTPRSARCTTRTHFRSSRASAVRPPLDPRTKRTRRWTPVLSGHAAGPSY